MERYERLLLISVLTVLVLLFAVGVTRMSFPCLNYPTAYSKVRDVGELVEAFRAKHGRLPNPGSRRDMKEFHLATGYSLENFLHHYVYTLRITPDVGPEYNDDSTMPFRIGFDGPWVVYDANAKSIVCGQ